MIKTIFLKSKVCQFFTRLIVFGLDLIDTWLIYKVLDEAMGKMISKTVVYSITFIIFLAVQLLISYILEKMCYKNKKLSSQKFREYICSQILNKMTIKGVAELRKRLSTDTTNISTYHTETMPNNSSGIIIVLSATVLIAFINIKIAMILFIISWIQIVPALIDKKWLMDNDEQTRQIEEDIDNFYLEVYNGFGVVKSYGLEDYVINKMSQFHKKYLSVGNRGEYNSSFMRMLTKMSTSIVSYGSYLLVGYFAYTKQISFTMIPVVIMISKTLFSEINKICDSMFSIYDYKVSKKRISDYYNDECVDNSSQGQYINEIKSITLENIGYSYDNNKDKMLFSNINLNVNDKEHILIGGKNGSGKSTLTKILLGNIDNYNGKILVNWSERDSSKSVELRQLNYASYARLVSFLPQEETVFHMTGKQLSEFLENKKLCNIEKLKDMLTKFNITDDLFEQKNLEELSGGECKKIFLSIALARNSDVVILDEPTNSLDEKSCNVLFDVLENTEKTLIVISHDLRISRLFTKQISLS